MRKYHSRTSSWCSLGIRVSTMALVAGLVVETAKASCTVSITNPPTSTSVPASPSSISLQGTADASVSGQLTWTNAAAAASGSISASTQWSINDIPLVAGTNIITVNGVELTSASTNASDNGGNYGGSWTNNSNGGSGFGAWTLSTTAGSPANGGHFIGSSRWGIYANSGHTSQGIRTFTNAMEVGQTFSFRMEHNWIQSGGGVGVALQNSTGTNLFQFWFIGGETYYRITGGTTDIAWTSAGFDISVTLTATNTFYAEVTQIGGSTKTYSGNLGGNGGSKAISRMRAWNNNAGSGSEYNFFVNNLALVSPPEAGDSCSDSITIVRDDAEVELYITEFMSSNSETIPDEDGNSEDWIEIFNAGVDPVNLDGYGLTDNPSNPFKWTFPSVTIGSGEHLLVWASSKNRRPHDGYLTNGLRRDVWNNISGHTVTALTDHVRYPHRPDERNILADLFEAPSSHGVNYGQRVHGYVVAPATGNYRFWIASDDYSVLLLSTDQNPANATEIASVPGWTTSRQWDKYSEQQSALIPLVEGQAYYISAIMKQGTGGDNLAVGWQLPSSTMERPIPGNRLFHTPELHTSYGLSVGGEALRLSKPNGDILDQVPPIPLITDVSYGRSPSDTNVWYYYDKDLATPGYANSSVGYDELLSAPVFSIAGGFYTSSISVSISLTSGTGVIRYTLDGSEPTTASPIYTNALSLGSRIGQSNQYANIQTSTGGATYEENWVAPGEVFKLNVVRARAFSTNGMPSLTTTRSYLVDTAGANRYSLPVISIATAPSNLFSSASGIYVPGNNVNYNQRGRAWERRGHLEFYESDGSLGFQSDVGLRISGNMSRRHPRKSLRVYARVQDGPNEINYQIFSDKNISTFKTFQLRNSGNDWAQSILRDSFMAKIAAHTGVDLQYTRPAIVFIDGEYWGVHEVRDRIDDGYHLQHNGLDEMEYTQLDIHHHSDAWKHLPVYDGGNPSPAMTNDFLDILNRAENNEYASSGSFTSLNSRIDVDNYIDYNIYQIFSGNTDWPGNNARVWRAVTPDTSLGANPRHDGRWRWILFDADLGFGLPYNYNPGYNSDPAVHASFNSLAFATATNNFSFGNSLNATRLLRKSLDNPVFQEKFASRFVDLLNTSLATSRTVSVLNDMQALYSPEMAEHKARWYYPTDWNSSIGRIRSFLNARSGHVWGHIRDRFNLSTPVSLTVNVTNSLEGTITVNSIVIDTNTVGVSGGYPWTGSYFTELPVTLTATPKPGYRFVEWIAVTSSVSVQATDAAENYSSWTNNSNGGSGFGSWTLQTTSGNSSQNGHFLSSGPPKRWGMYANSSQEANAIRNLSSSMSVGQSFRARFQNSYIGSGGSVGIALQNSSGQPLWEFYFIGGESSYRLNGAASGIGFTTQSIDVEVTLTGSTNYSARITVGGSVHTFTGNLISQSNQTISRFREWNYNAGADNNLYLQNLSVVTKTQSAPASYSTNQSITVTLNGDAEFVAVFEEVPPIPERTVVHYWNFNDSGSLLTASYTVGGATWIITNGPSTEVLSGTGQDFFGENARFGDSVGSHLRVNNPIGATMIVRLPTTNYEDILVKYETRRSGSGAGTQYVDYSIDGTNYTAFATISPVDGTPALETFDFSAVSGVSDNPNFALRVTFAQGSGGTVGNNRFDNFTLDGRSMGEINLPPVVDDPPGLQFLIENDGATNLDLDLVFSDPNDDSLTYGANSDNTNVVLAGISGNELVLVPLLRGDANITVSADDGVNAPVQTSFRVLVYPEPYILEGGIASFTEWSSSEPTGAYPEYMIFLQGTENDTTITSKLEHAYHIPLADAASTNDANFPYAATSRTRINGLGTNGISFINTGRGRDLGGALMAIDTLNIPGAWVTWVGGTVTPNVRVYAVRLQYRVGVEGEFLDVLDGTNAVQYVRNATAGHSDVIGPVELPPEAIGEEYVQLLWRYYLLSGSSGARAELRVDDIIVEADE